jgi:BolA protein
MTTFDMPERRPGDIMTALQPQEAAPPRAERIRNILTRAFAPARLDIVDDSARHAGHAGAAGGASETHFSVAIVSDVFTHRSRVERSRMVHEALAGEFAAGLHALSLHLRSPSE